MHGDTAGTEMALRIILNSLRRAIRLMRAGKIEDAEEIISLICSSMDICIDPNEEMFKGRISDVHTLNRAITAEEMKRYIDTNEWPKE